MSTDLIKYLYRVGPLLDVLIKAGDKIEWQRVVTQAINTMSAAVSLPSAERRFQNITRANAHKNKIFFSYKTLN